MAHHRALCAALLFSMVLMEAHGTCDYGPRDRLSRQPYDALILGAEEDWTDVLRLTLEVIATAFGGEGLLMEHLREKGVQEVQAVGIKNILKLVQSGGSLVVGNKRLRGGILHYNCQLCDICRWCCWGDWPKISCFTSCEHCGADCRNDPIGKSQPYIIITKNTFKDGPQGQQGQPGDALMCDLKVSLPCEQITLTTVN